MLKVAAAALPLVLLAGTADARPGSMFETRGHDKCVEAFEAETHALVVDRRYYIDQRSPETNTFYINGVDFTLQGKEDVRIACETPKRGHRVLTAVVEPGHFSPRTSVTIDIAAN